MHIERRGGGAVVERTERHSHLRTIDEQLGVHTGARRGWVEAKGRVEGEVAYALTIVGKTLDVGKARARKVLAVKRQIEVGIHHTCHLGHVGYETRPFLDAHIGQIHAHHLGSGARGTIGDDLYQTLIVSQLEVGVYHAGVIVITQYVVIVHRPLLVTYHRLLGEEAHVHSGVGERGVATQPVAHLLVDVVLRDEEIYRGPYGTALDVDLGKLVHCAAAIAHVGVEGEIFLKFIGVEREGVDEGRAVGEACQDQVGIHVVHIVAHRALGAAEVHVVALKKALHQSIAPQLGLELEGRQAVLQRVDVERALAELLGGEFAHVLHALHKGFQTHLRVEVEVVVLVVEGDMGLVVIGVEVGGRLVRHKSVVVHRPV